MPMASAAWATGQPASMRWHSSSRPVGVRGALRWDTRTSGLVSWLRHLHTYIRRSSFWWTPTASTTSVGSTPRERWQKQRRLQVLTARLAEVQNELAGG